MARREDMELGRTGGNPQRERLFRLLEKARDLRTEVFRFLSDPMKLSPVQRQLTTTECEINAIEENLLAGMEQNQYNSEEVKKERRGVSVYKKLCWVVSSDKEKD